MILESLIEKNDSELFLFFILGYLLGYFMFIRLGKILLKESSIEQFNSPLVFI